MSGGVAMGRTVAAADMCAHRAAPEMHPTGTDALAVDAAVAAGYFGLQAVEVGALVAHGPVATRGPADGGGGGGGGVPACIAIRYSG